MTSSITENIGKQREVSRRVRIPGATCRLQFNGDFTFRDAIAIAPYLRELGIMDVYASPLLTATTGSTHGYDTCCPGEISPQLGGDSGFEAFAAALRENGLGLLLDIVPNHMAASPLNPWWWDVLKFGQRSAFAGFFDIDWTRNNAANTGKIVLPVLGRRLPEVLRAGELKIARVEGEPRIAYFENKFPLAPETPRAWIERVEHAQQQGDHAPCVDVLLAILDAQHYRLAFWRIGPEEINYRRFFDVTALVSLRMEDERVFEATHSKLATLIQSGAVTGFRVDHPDGLRDPRQYFERLQALRPSEPIYVVAEKILSGNEPLSSDWAVNGTTGYDFLNQVNGLFVVPESEAAFDEIYSAFGGSAGSYPEAAYRAKKRILELSFRGDVDALASRLHQLAAALLDGRDFTWRQLRRAIVEVIACLPVYRTYVDESSIRLSEQDANVLAHSCADAKRRSPSNADAIDFVLSILDLRLGIGAELEGLSRDFIRRFQQLSGPATAKGLEDTAFYNYVRFVSLNEVGGEPGQFGNSVEEFHQSNIDRAQHWPHSLLCTATHDTKRGEDVRARLNVLSEMPDEWRAAVMQWREWNRKFKRVRSHGETPGADDEYLLYQTLVGAWDDSELPETFRHRINGYMLKAAREAKRNTSWTEQNAEYESALSEFVNQVLDRNGNELFVAELSRTAAHVAYFGRFNSLAQTLLKLTTPGVPDLYQGCELWDLSLVDPDNRRPVDFALRQEMLARLMEKPPSPSEMRSLFDDSRGAIKLWLIACALRCRNAHREVFDDGEYVPLEVFASAPLRRHFCAFARVRGDSAAIVVVPRFLRTLLNGVAAFPSAATWGDAELALPEPCSSSVFVNAITGEEISASSGRLRVGELFAALPAALVVAAR